MHNFIIENNFLILSKSLRTTKKDNNGVSKQYGSISLYCPDTDDFQKIFIFDNFESILSRYEVMKNYKIKIQVSINDNKTYLKIL